MQPILDVVDLRRSFGTLYAVDGVSFSVTPGEVFGLLGPNGAGKSTTMTMICGLLEMDSGAIHVDGHSITADPIPVRRLLGMVPQDLAIYPDLSAYENLQFFGSLYDLGGERLRQRLQVVLEQIGLWERKDDAAKDFSGGMKRRLNFAAAILHEPRLLILDEPTVGVDPQSRHHLLECIRSLRDEGTAVIYASHYMEEVEAICTRVAVMDHGRILACDTLEKLMSQVPRKVELLVPSEFDAGELDESEGITIARCEDGTTLSITERSSKGPLMTQRLAELMAHLNQHQIPLLSIRTHEPSLERLFMDLTGTGLRD